MVRKVYVNVVDGDKNCLSGPRPISPPQVMNAKMQISETPLEEQPTAFDAAVEEEARLKAVEQGRSIQAVEALVKAEVRGESAIRRARVQQHYDSLLRRLDEIARVDFRDHQRHIASSMALYSAEGERAEALEEKRERAFEAINAGIPVIFGVLRLSQYERPHNDHLVPDRAIPISADSGR
ncbi:unnamed protein product [Schistocephalus solidus]|uniref:MICOS complex subunit MIC60 n=1 Tax=Schistocephalus solidus TaxID=70667 RepID=A0A183S9W6_SCHSO|nr:unnamed protein product [Schistocephalus solidus]